MLLQHSHLQEPKSSDVHEYTPMVHGYKNIRDNGVHTVSRLGACIHLKIDLSPDFSKSFMQVRNTTAVLLCNVLHSVTQLEGTWPKMDSGNCKETKSASD